MKKVIIAANDMMIGGIENSLISLLNSIDYKKYHVTLLLQDKNGKLLDQIPNQVTVIEYKPLINGNILVRKIKNRLKYIKFIQKKYDIGICYTSYTPLMSKIIRKVAKNNFMWIHTDYTFIYNKKEFDKFVKLMEYKKFKNLVFVSETAKNNYIKNYNLKQNCFVCHNLLDKDLIIEKSHEKLEYSKEKLTFINISRHDEPAKKISRIIEATNNLIKKGYDFNVLLIGDGKDSKLYKKLVKKYDLQNNIEFIGSKKNPFPYYKYSDCFLLTSDYEGGPITIYESLILNTPVITTKVGDIEKYITPNNGILIEKAIKDLEAAMIKFIENKNNYVTTFDVEKYNKEIKIVLNKKIFGDKNEI